MSCPAECSAGNALLLFQSRVTSSRSIGRAGRSSLRAGSRQGRVRSAECTREKVHDNGTERELASVSCQQISKLSQKLVPANCDGSRGAPFTTTSCCQYSCLTCPYVRTTTIADCHSYTCIHVVPPCLIVSFSPPQSHEIVIAVFFRSGMLREYILRVHPLIRSLLLLLLPRFLLLSLDPSLQAESAGRIVRR